MNKKDKYTIDGFPCITDIHISNKIIYATINLESLEYVQDSLDTLLNSVAKLKSIGFTKFDTSYNTGYYDSIEDISIELMENISKIDLKQLTKIS